MGSPPHEEISQKLKAEHDRLIAELRAIATPDGKLQNEWHAKPPQFEEKEYGSHASLEEEADEVEEYEGRLATEHSLESRLLEVTKALERIQKGTYGTCGQCRKAIPEERLAANPAAEFCFAHSPQS